MGTLGKMVAETWLSNHWQLQELRKGSKSGDQIGLLGYLKNSAFSKNNICGRESQGWWPMNSAANYQVFPELRPHLHFEVHLHELFYHSSDSKQFDQLQGPHIPSYTFSRLGERKGPGRALIQEHVFLGFG